jgi:hypothetical protein
MAKRTKLKESDLISIIDREVSHSSTYNTKISKDRATAIKYFNKEPFGNEKKGRSGYVSSEVSETISWCLPQILKVFYAEDSVQFDPIGPGSEQAAELATQYCQYVLYKKNNGHLILHDFFMDALLQKNGILKIYFDNAPEYTREEYQGLSDVELTQLLQDESVEPVEHETIEGPIDPITGETSQLHDLTIKRKKNKTGKVKIINIPPEELVVSSRAKSLDLDEAPFVAHRVKKTISWLRQQGYTISDDINDGTEDQSQFSAEKIARDVANGSFFNDNVDSGTPIDPSQREVWVVEAYFKCDFDGDGIAEMRKVTKIGGKVLDNDEVFTQPFISTSPFPQPHKWNGRSMADEVKDLQLLKSMLMRAMLDSFAFNINPSKAVDMTKIVDPNDLLDTNPGNYIKMRGDINNAFYAMPSSGVGTEAFSLLGYIDNIAESRSGVSKMTQGIDANVFNKTATGTQAIMSASQEKIALIVRLLAETGITPMYKKIIQLAANYADGPELIRINSEFAEVNPKQWANLDTITVCVGTGALDKSQDLANLNQLMQIQNQMGGLHPQISSMVDPEKVHNAVTRLVKGMGFKNPTEFFNDPRGQEYGMLLQQASQPVPPPIDPNIEMVKVEKQKAEQNMLIKTAEFELDKLKADRQFELDKFETRLKYSIEADKLAQKDQHKIIDQLSQLAALEPGQGLLPQSEIAAIQDVGMISQPHQPQQSPEPLQPDPNQLLMMQMMDHLHQQQPKAHRVIRDENGKISGIVQD